MTLNPEKFRKKKLRKRLRRQRIIAQRLKTYGEKSLPKVDARLNAAWKAAKKINFSPTQKKSIWKRIEDWLREHYR